MLANSAQCSHDNREIKLKINNDEIRNAKDFQIVLHREQFLDENKHVNSMSQSK